TRPARFVRPLSSRRNMSNLALSCAAGWLSPQVPPATQLLTVCGPGAILKSLQFAEFFRQYDSAPTCPGPPRPALRKPTMTHQAPSFGCSSFQRGSLTRRQLLQVGALGLFGLHL